MLQEDIGPLCQIDWVCEEWVFILFLIVGFLIAVVQEISGGFFKMFYFFVQEMRRNNLLTRQACWILPFPVFTLNKASYPLALVLYLAYRQESAFDPHSFPCQTNSLQRIGDEVQNSTLIWRWNGSWIHQDSIF